MVLWNIFDRRKVALVAVGAAICWGGSLRAQSGQNSSSTPPANSQSQPGNNDFPMAQSAAAAKAASQNAAGSQRDQQSGDAGTGNSQQAPSDKDSGDQKNNSNSANSGGKSQSSPAKDNPFPEDQSAAAAKANPDNETANPSSAPQAYSSSDANLPPPDVGEGNIGKKEKLDSFTRDQTMDGRIQDDLNVADLYMKDGNYRGAFLRYTDALRFDPQDDTALFGVAQSMCKQNMTGDAMAHFKSYAKEHPQGKYAMKAEKMLEHPNKCMHNW